MEKSKLEAFLGQYTIPGTNGYLLGVFQPGITVYNQQLRSLNILHAMLELRALGKSDRVAVIGGGIAGLTFATAALKLGHSIDLFEKSQILVPYQYGCDTRRIHPHFYLWPEPLTEYPYCDLPFFNWSHETASTVSKNIYDTFKNVKNRASGRYNEYRGTKLSKGDISWGRDETSIEFDSGEGQRQKRYSKVIVATGFGIEKRIQINLNSETKETTSTCLSYWRNDDFEQTSLTKDAVNTYVISGTGDGALIDLFRLKLRGFTVKLLLDKLKLNISNYNALKLRLRETRNRYEKQPINEKLKNNSFLYDEFEVLRTDGILKALTGIVNRLTRSDNFVIIHHHDLAFKEVFDLRRASMFNNLIAYTLLANSKSGCGFKRVPFDVSYAPWSKDDIFLLADEIRVEKESEIENNRQLSTLFKSLKHKYPDQINENNLRLILRHGTKVEESLAFIGLTPQQIAEIKGKQHRELVNNHLRPVWLPGWWNKFFKEKEEPIEFVEPELVLMSNSFVSSLASVIKLHAGNQSNFRIVLHRVIRKNDWSFYQQVSHYFGDRKNERLNGPVGRIFPLDVGLVGYTCKTGRSLLLQKLKDIEGYRTTWNALMTEEAARREAKFSDFQNNDFTTDNLETVDTLFTCPILFEKEAEISPIFCLYIDSKDLDFEKLNFLETIYSMLVGFVSLLDRASKEQKIIQTEDLTESLFQIDPNFKNEGFNSVIEESKSLRSIEKFEDFKAEMMFRDSTPHYITAQILG